MRGEWSRIAPACPALAPSRVPYTRLWVPRGRAIAWPSRARRGRRRKRSRKRTHSSPRCWHTRARWRRPSSRAPDSRATTWQKRLRSWRGWTGETTGLATPPAREPSKAPSSERSQRGVPSRWGSWQRGLPQPRLQAGKSCAVRGTRRGLPRCRRRTGRAWPWGRPPRCWHTPGSPPAAGACCSCSRRCLGHRPRLPSAPRSAFGPSHSARRLIWTVRVAARAMLPPVPGTSSRGGAGYATGITALAQAMAGDASPRRRVDAREALSATLAHCCPRLR